MIAAAVILKGALIWILIHIILPLALWITFRGMAKQIKEEGIKQAPLNDLAFIFATYGGLLYVVLTILCLSGSGIFYIVTFYLILVGPLLMGYIAYKNWNIRTVSIYHKWTYRLGLSYMIVPMSLLAFMATII